MSVSEDIRGRLGTDTDYYAPRPEPDEVDLGAELTQLDLSRRVSLEKREANALLAERVRGSAGETVPFVCECGDPDCIGRVDLAVQDYERLARFGFVGGRDCPDGPRLLRAG